MSMHRFPISIVVYTAAALAVTAACKSEGAKAEAAPREQSAAEQPSPAQNAESSAKDKTAALASYERVRAALAKDAVTTATTDAASLEQSARAVAATGARQAGAWGKIADAAKTLRETPKEDADAVRRAFGEVSRHMVVALKSDPGAAKGLHVFECPMAQGYKKWVQPSAELENPYMGTRMPKCGSESSL